MKKCCRLYLASKIIVCAPSTKSKAKRTGYRATNASNLNPTRPDQKNAAKCYPPVLFFPSFLSFLIVVKQFNQIQQRQKVKRNKTPYGTRPSMMHLPRIHFLKKKKKNTPIFFFTCLVLFAVYQDILLKKIFALKTNALSQHPLFPGLKLQRECLAPIPVKSHERGRSRKMALLNWSLVFVLDIYARYCMNGSPC